jgi:hypothetical protein
MTRRAWPRCTSIAIAIDLGIVLAVPGILLLQNFCPGGRWFLSLCHEPTTWWALWLLVLVSAPVGLVFSIIGMSRRSRPPSGGSRVPVLVFSFSLLAAAVALLVSVLLTALLLTFRGNGETF